MSKIQKKILNIFSKLGYRVSDPILETENDYDTSYLKVGKLNIRYSQGKITPTKKGQFVTLWKRGSKGVIEPFDLKDPIDFVLVAVENSKEQGFFLFSKKDLSKNGVFSVNKKGGKRALRLYPDWETDLNSQALKTQAWQTGYFFNLASDKTLAGVSKVLKSKP